MLIVCQALSYVILQCPAGYPRGIFVYKVHLTLNYSYYLRQLILLG